MRLHRFLVPLAAAIVLLGVFVALAIALNRPGTGVSSASRPLEGNEIADLLALKNQAEALAIDGKLAAAHAKYRELFVRAQGREIRDPKDSPFWDLLERAKIDQDRVYLILLARPESDSAGVLTPLLPASARSATTVSTVAATTRSFVEIHPPYSRTTTAPATRPASTVATALAALAARPQPAAAEPAEIEPLPEPKHLKIARTLPDASGFSDVLVGQALAQANDFLVAQFKDGEIQQGKELSETYRQGLNALCIYALVQSGQATRDPRLAVTGEFMRHAIEKMKLQPMATDTSKAQQPVVYARSLRAAVLAAGNRPDDRDLLKDDVQWLIDAAVDGAYTYDDRFTVRVIGADPRGAGRNVKPNMPEPAGINPVKPNTLGPPRNDQPVDPAKTPAGGPGARAFWGDWRDQCAPGEEPQGPLPIQLADGIHINGKEVGPILSRRYPPPPQAPRYPPQELPEKYGGTFVWDNSNSQYGLLGVWAGAEVGIEVPDGYWAAAEKHWMSSQLARGEWPYRKDVPGGRMSMTCAGIASLLVTHDYLEAPSVAKVGRQASPAGQAMANGFAWLEKGDNAVNVTGPRMVYLGYTLHALSRVGLASGYKYLGAHDWYRELARKVALSQWENGSWGRSDEASADTLIDTAYTILFLARGRHPIVMNKLRLDEGGKADRGEWNNRPRDLANLCRFASRELERPVNWQIVSIDREPADWSDAPILYLASHSALRLSDQDISKIRAFVEGGGMLFTQADNNADAFNLYVNQLAKRLFPEHELKDLPADDEIYSLQYIIAKPNRPRLRAASNGVRLLWVHSPTDLAVHWQQRAEQSKRDAFEMGVNLFVYAAGKTDLRNRIDERAIPKPNFEASSKIRLARLKYAGNWDPEPAAFERFSRYLQWETSIGLEPVTIEIAALKPTAPAIAHLSGSAPYTPTDGEIQALREYVESGGTLIVEGVGGADSGFANAMQGTVLPQAFPGTKFEALPPEHPMLHASFKGMEDVWPPRLRAYAIQKLGKAIPPIRETKFGKGRVIYLPLDMTSGLLGSNTWPIFGYDAGEAQALMKNILLWTVENSAP